MYCCGHPGTFNPAVITNKEAHMVCGNMNKDAGEVVTLIKFSPKRENLLGEIKENFEEPESTAKGIIGLCPTRWTMHASYYSSMTGPMF